jgi:transposase
MRLARRRTPGHTRTCSQGADPNYKGSFHRRDEPDDHAVGRSRGGLSTKVHLLVDNTGRPLVVFASAGQAGDSPALVRMLEQLRVARRGPGRPRTTPVLLRGDKAYSARANRHELRRRRIKAVIPEPADQAGHRKRRGSRGGRPISYDPMEYKGRNVIERGINILKQWRGLATRYDKHALTYRGGVVLAAILAWL